MWIKGMLVGHLYANTMTEACINTEDYFCLRIHLGFFFFSQRESQENKMWEVWESERKMAVMSSMKVTQASCFEWEHFSSWEEFLMDFFIFFVSKPATEITFELSGSWNLIMNLHSDSRQSVPGNESIHSQISFTPSFTLQVLSGHRR